MACVTLVSQSGIELTPLELEAWSLNHWKSREVPTEFSDAAVFTVSLLLILNWIKVVLHTL